LFISSNSGTIKTGHQDIKIHGLNKLFDIRKCQPVEAVKTGDPFYGVFGKVSIWRKQKKLSEN